MPAFPAPFPILLTPEPGGLDFYRLILGLLPAIYRDQEDLQVIIHLIAVVAEEAKGDMDRLAELVDRDQTPDEMLTYLSRQLGLPHIFSRSGFDHLRHRRIREGLAIFRRKTTRDALERDLREQGWDGVLIEGKDAALRLNVRGRLNAANTRLDGRLYNHGSVVFLSEGYVDWGYLSKTLNFHRPAGARFLHFGKFTDGISDPLLDGGGTWGRVIGFAGNSYLPAPFIVQRSRLNGEDHLNRGEGVPSGCAALASDGTSRDLNTI